MVEYNNEMRGALFRVSEDRKVEKGPDYTGNCEIKGVKYFLSAWINTSRTGSKYMAIRFKIDDRDRAESRENLERAKKESQRPLSSDVDVDDGIPF